MKVLLGAISIALFVSNSTTCYLAWQVVTVSKLYLNNHAHFFIHEFSISSDKTSELSTENPLCFIFKDKVNAIKFYDARCISNRNISE